MMSYDIATKRTVKCSKSIQFRGNIQNSLHRFHILFFSHGCCNITLEVSVYLNNSAIILICRKNVIVAANAVPGFVTFQHISALPWRADIFTFYI